MLCLKFLMCRKSTKWWVFSRWFTDTHSGHEFLSSDTYFHLLMEVLSFHICFLSLALQWIFHPMYKKKIATEGNTAKYWGMREFGDWPLVTGKLGQQDLEFPKVSLIVQTFRATLNLQVNNLNLNVELTASLQCFIEFLLCFLFSLTLNL